MPKDVKVLSNSWQRDLPEENFYEKVYSDLILRNKSSSKTGCLD